MVFYLPTTVCIKNLGCLWRKRRAICFSVIFLSDSKSWLNFRSLRRFWNCPLFLKEEGTVFCFFSFPIFLANKEKQISEKHGTEQEVFRGLVILVRYEKAPLHSHIVSFMDLTLPTLRIPSSPRAWCSLQSLIFILLLLVKTWNVNYRLASVTPAKTSS